MLQKISHFIKSIISAMCGNYVNALFKTYRNADEGMPEKIINCLFFLVGLYFLVDHLDSFEFLSSPMFWMTVYFEFNKK